MITEKEISIIEKILSSEENNKAEAESKLIEFINDLINKDFNGLVQLLYRIDVDEKKLKDTLKSHLQKDAGFIIAKLIIERQMKKIKSKKQFGKPGNCDEEKW